MAKSAALNSYGIFHPKGPNFLLSKTNAWKNERPNNNLFHTPNFEDSYNLTESSKILLSYDKYDLIKEFFMPFGGS